RRARRRRHRRCSCRSQCLLEGVINGPPLPCAISTGDDRCSTAVFHKCPLLVPLLRRRSPCCWQYHIKCRASPLPALPPLGLPPPEGRWMAVCGVRMCLHWYYHQLEGRSLFPVTSWSGCS